MSPPSDASTYPLSGSGESPGVPPLPPVTRVILEPPPRPRRGRRVVAWLFRLLLVASLLGNVAFWYSLRDEPGPAKLGEQFHSGDAQATDRLAIIRIVGTIMPPFTARTIREIDQAKDDEHVRGVLLVIDSPGGLVADSHQIYHRLTQLREKKPICVAMKSYAASGGLYVAMGAGRGGKIFAEPTTWTGSIGVIIPRFEVAELANRFGVASKPLKTGELKDALSPFRPLSEKEQAVWNDLLDQSFQRFLNVIADNRAKLTLDQVRALATGQIYTADDAVKHNLIDGIGFEEDALDDLQQQLGLTQVRVIEYSHPLSWIDLLSASLETQRFESRWRSALESTVPQAMYYCSWLPIVPRW